MNKENKIILYKDDDGKVSVNTRFADEDVWLTQAQLVEIYQSSKSNISEHLTNIFADKELEQDAVVRKFRTTATDGKNYQVMHYNLDVVIALGYRVQSPIAVRFRRWATQRLHEYIQKGFTMDDERLKQGGNRYFRELLQRIRDIRSSERNFYQQVTDIYATSTDYDPRAKMTKLFFATVQNKMHYAVHEHTAAELIYERVDNEKPFVGMTNFKGNYVTRDDVKIAKNYLTELELQRLNLLTSQFLDYAEFQALEQNPMTMAEWIKALDDQILRLRKNILEGTGTISHQEAIEKAEREFEIYREREMRMLESDFDKAVKRLMNKADDAEEENV
ncbi:MAG: virulence RhuM family protein [Prevotella sp.]|nr:virulence RhuM family protein [Prevotella sp.]